MNTTSFKLPNNGVDRNPLGQRPDFTHRRPFTPWSVVQWHALRTTVQEPGVVRRFWRALARYTGPGREFSWTANGFDGGTPRPDGPSTTRLNLAIDGGMAAVLHGGNQLSRPMQRPQLTPSVAAAAPRLITNGNVRNRPVLRVRIPSYGSRVPALNTAGPGTQQ